MDPVTSPNGETPAPAAPETPQQPTTAAPAPETVTLSKADLQAMVDENARAKGYVVALTRELANMREQPRESEMPPRERQQAIRELLNDDPETALDAHFRERVAPIVRQNHQTLASINRERAMDRIGKEEWQEWGAKIDEFLAPFDEATKAEPGAYENAYNFVRLKHVDDIVEKKLRAKQQEAQRGALLEGSSSNGAASKVNRQMSSIEKQIAKEFGMTDEEWQQYSVPGPRAEEE